MPPRVEQLAREELFTTWKLQPEPGRVSPVGCGVAVALEVLEGGFPGLRAWTTNPVVEGFDLARALPLERVGDVLPVSTSEVFVQWPSESPMYGWRPLILRCWRDQRPDARPAGSLVTYWREGTINVAPLSSQFLGDWVHNVPWGSGELGRQAWSMQTTFVGYLEGTFSGSPNSEAFILYAQNATKTAQIHVLRVFPSQIGAIIDRAVNLGSLGAAVPPTAWRWQLRNDHASVTAVCRYLIGTRSTS